MYDYFICAEILTFFRKWFAFFFVFDFFNLKVNNSWTWQAHSLLLSRYVCYDTIGKQLIMSSPNKKKKQTKNKTKSKNHFKRYSYRVAFLSTALSMFLSVCLCLCLCLCLSLPLSLSLSVFLSLTGSRVKFKLLQPPPPPPPPPFSTLFSPLSILILSFVIRLCIVLVDINVKQNKTSK